MGMGMICAASLAAAQTPKAEQVMDTKRQHIAEIAALTGRGDLAGLESALVAGLDDGMTVNELKEVMVHPTPIADSRGPCAGCKPWSPCSTGARPPVPR